MIWNCPMMGLIVLVFWGILESGEREPVLALRCLVNSISITVVCTFSFFKKLHLVKHMSNFNPLPFGKGLELKITSLLLVPLSQNHVLSLVPSSPLKLKLISYSSFLLPLLILNQYLLSACQVVCDQLPFGHKKISQVCLNLSLMGVILW